MYANHVTNVAITTRIRNAKQSNRRTWCVYADTRTAYKLFAKNELLPLHTLFFSRFYFDSIVHLANFVLLLLLFTNERVRNRIITCRHTAVIGAQFYRPMRHSCISVAMHDIFIQIHNMTENSECERKKKKGSEVDTIEMGLSILQSTNVTP